MHLPVELCESLRADQVTDEADKKVNRPITIWPNAYILHL